MSKITKLMYKDVKEFVENKGYKLISKNYINIDEKIIIQDNVGYLYVINFYHFNKGQKPNMFHKNNPYTIENIKLFLRLNYNKFQLLTDKYIKSSQKITLIDSYNFLYTISINKLQLGRTPYMVSTFNPYTIQNIKLWCELNSKPFKLLSDKYKNNSFNLKWQCLNNDCQEIFNMGWGYIQNSYGCPFCAGKQVGLSNCLATRNPELAKEWHPTKNGDITPYDIVSNFGNNIWWICKDCGFEWEATPNNRNNKNNQTGCPKCFESKGEKKLTFIFKINNISNFPQYKFSNCKYKKELIFDYYLPDFNICIEYQGLQHYEPVDFAGKGDKWAKEQFVINQEKDQIKRDYCNKNNIKLIEIPYWDFENIEKILNKEILTK